MSAPIWLTRVTDGMRFGTAKRNLLEIMRDLDEGQNVLSTGRKVNKPSDDPLAATRIMNLDTALRKTEEYERSLDVAKRRLGHIDTVLSDMNDITNRAREILMSQIGDTATEQTRRNASFEVANLIDRAMSLANRTLEDRYIFSGLKTDTSPFTTVGQYVLFQGTADEWTVPIGTGETIASSVSARAALGARSAEIEGRADLTPALRLSTRLSDLNRGRGVRLGRILVGDGTNTAEVDLSGSVDLEDVANRINATGLVNVTLRADRLGLRLEAPGKNISVLEVDEGHTAADLGILKSNAGQSFDGEELNPALRLTTRIDDLRGGQGIDLSGLVVHNGDVTVTVDLSGVTDVNGLISRINRSGAYVQAELNESRTGINLFSLLNGAEFTVEENGGTTATDLGLLLQPAELPLSRLNRGFGVQTNYGPDFTITLHDGTVLSVDVSSAETLADVVELINGSAGNEGKLTARYGAGESLELVDATSGTGELTVSSVKGSLAARHLGIEGSTAAGVLAGEQLNPAGIRIDGLFNALIALRDALAADDSDTLTLVGGSLDSAQNLLLDARADVGGRLNRLEMAADRFSEDKVRLQEALSEERDADLAEAVLSFQQDQMRLQAALGAIGMTANHSLLDFLR